MEPTETDLKSPEFQAVWNAIKGWDIQREEGRGYAGATGTDVMTILNALRSIKPEPAVDVKEKIFDWTTSTDIETAVGEAVGAASACWENLSGAGVFESTRAKQIVDELVEYIRSKQPIY